MKDLKGFWIRNDRNVQVKCHGKGGWTDDPERITVSFKNGHVRFYKEDQFLSEFINLDELLAEITKGSQWDAIEGDYKITVTEVRVRAGIVHYRVDGNPPEWFNQGVYIWNFKKVFKA